jgi:hypothetical protein
MLTPLLMASAFHYYKPPRHVKTSYDLTADIINPLSDSKTLLTDKISQLGSTALRTYKFGRHASPNTSLFDFFNLRQLCMYAGKVCA